MAQNSQQVHSKLSQNNETLNMSPQVHTIPKVMNKSKVQFKKALKDNDDPYLALLAVRTSSGPENNTPSATLFQNRTIRTLIP